MGTLDILWEEEDSMVDIIEEVMEATEALETMAATGILFSPVHFKQLPFLPATLYKKILKKTAEDGIFLLGIENVLFSCYIVIWQHCR